MKIDKKMIDMLLGMNDSQLWQMIMLVAGQSGLNASGIKKPQNMDSLRAALSSLTETDISRASEIIDIYKNKK